jgi:hypothetical protein
MSKSPAAVELCIRRLLDSAQQEARAMVHEYIGTEHLLLAIISSSDPDLSSILSNHGITKESVKKILLQLPPENFSIPGIAQAEDLYRHKLRKNNAPRLASWDTEAVGVPRRFGMSIMFMMVTMYALLFAFLKTMGTPPVWFAIIAIFITGVGFAQMAMFGSKYPRAASVWAGAILLPIEIAVLTIGYAIFIGAVTGENIFLSLILTIVCIPLGAFFGYLAGGLTAGAFLLVELYISKTQPIEAELVPEDEALNESDIPAQPLCEHDD